MGARMARCSALIGAAVLSVALLSGCFGAASQVDDQNKQYRTYMSQVNQIMVELDESLESFTDAVSRDDVVNMESQLDQALKVLDKLDGLDVPASMKDVQKGYQDATDTLEKALRDYVDLYAEIDGAAQGGTVDWSAYDSRIEEIQKAYSDGVTALKDADAAAAKAGTF